MSSAEKHKKIPELVMGVRNQAALKSCCHNADAVYFSLDRFSLRSRAQEITADNLDAFVREIHNTGLKGYLAVNSVIYPDDTCDLEQILDCASTAKVDAVIAWDPATIIMAAERDLKIHISTQANVSNHLTAESYRSLGASRVVLARELSLSQIKKISENTDIELEVFVHGAMCHIQNIRAKCQV